MTAADELVFSAMAVCVVIATFIIGPAIARATIQSEKAQ